MATTSGTNQRLIATVPIATRKAIIEDYISRLAGNLLMLKLTFLQREMVKAALRTAIVETPIELPADNLHLTQAGHFSASELRK